MGYRTLIIAFVILVAGCVPVGPARETPTSLPRTTAPATARPSAQPTPGQERCIPTPDDGVTPIYRPGAPQQTVVGQGHILRGAVRSSLDCTPIAGATVEVIPEFSGQGHPDDTRATLVTGENGEFIFECDPPEHIHMRISAPGHRTIGSNSYHPNGAAEGTIEIVLEPVE